MFVILVICPVRHDVRTDFVDSTSDYRLLFFTWVPAHRYNLASMRNSTRSTVTVAKFDLKLIIQKAKHRSATHCRAGGKRTTTLSTRRFISTAAARDERADKGLKGFNALATPSRRPLFSFRSHWSVIVKLESLFLFNVAPALFWSAITASVHRQGRRRRVRSRFFRPLGPGFA